MEESADPWLAEVHAEGLAVRGISRSERDVPIAAHIQLVVLRAEEGEGR